MQEYLTDLGSFLGNIRSRFRYISYGTGILILFALFWLFRSFHDSVDSPHWVRMVPQGEFFLREPLATWMQHLFWRATSFIVYNTRDSIALLNTILGVISVVLILKISKEIAENSKGFYIVSGILLTTYGVVQFFFGYVETYPIFTFFVFLYIWISLLFLRNKISLILSSLVYGIAFIVHLSGAWFFFSLIFLYLHEQIREGWKHPLRRLIAVGFAASAPVIILFGYLIVTKYDTGILRFLNAFLAELRVGKDQAMFIPLNLLISKQHILDVFNEYMLLSPAGIVLFIILLQLLLTKRLNFNDTKLLFFSTLAIPYMIYTFTWNPDLGARYDWDLFAPVAGPFTLLGSYVFVRYFEDKRLLSYLGILLISLGIFHSVPVILRNSSSDSFAYFKDKSIPEMQIVGLSRLVDKLDAGDKKDEESHNYRIDPSGARVIQRAGYVDNLYGKSSWRFAFLLDDGRKYKGYEEFFINTIPGHELEVLKRIDTDIGNQTVDVYIDDKYVGQWKIPGKKKNYFYSFVYNIPGEFIRESRTKIKFAFVNSDEDATSYYYWFYQ